MTAPIQPPEPPPARAPGEPETEGRPARRVLPALGFVLLVVVALAGFLLGRASADPEPRAAAPRLIESGPFALEVPSDWREPPEPTAITGLELDHRIERAPPDGRTGSSLIVGVAAVEDGSLLPPALRLRADGALPDGGARLAGLEALHYAAIRAPRAGEPIELFASPFRDGALTAACVGGDPGFRRSCDAAVATLRLTHGRGFPLGADLQLGEALDDAVKHVAAVRRRGVAAMGTARRARGQAAAARSVSGAFAAAARRVGNGSRNPASGRTRQRIAARLEVAARAWRRIARAAAQRSDEAYESARRLVTSSENEVRTALAGVGASDTPAPAPTVEPAPSATPSAIPTDPDQCPHAPHETPVTIPDAFRGYVRLCRTPDGRSMRVETISRFAITVSSHAPEQVLEDVPPGSAGCRDGADECTLPPGATLLVGGGEPVRILLAFAAWDTAAANLAKVASDTLLSKVTPPARPEQRLFKCIEGTYTTIESPSPEEAFLTGLGTAKGCKSLVDDLSAKKAQATRRTAGRIFARARKLTLGAGGELALLAGKVLIRGVP